MLFDHEDRHIKSRVLSDIALAVAFVEDERSIVGGGVCPGVKGFFKIDFPPSIYHLLLDTGSTNSRTQLPFERIIIQTPRYGAYELDSRQCPKEDERRRQPWARRLSV